MNRTILAATFSVAALPALAQDVAITGVKAQAFLERSGKLSDDLVAAKKPFKNLVRPDGDLGEPANALLITLAFSGPKNTEGSKKVARDLAQVTVKQTSGDAPKTLLYRAFGGFSFGPDGQAYRAFMLDDATCAPLEIEVKVGRTQKTQALDLACETPVAAAATAPTNTGKPAAPRR
jgi:hypothetical protein